MFKHSCLQPADSDMVKISVYLARYASCLASGNDKDVDPNRLSALNQFVNDDGHQHVGDAP